MAKERFPGRLALSARIREAIVPRILNGEFKPGERLLEMRLAEEFGTSQAPVREALRELEMSGMVESSRNRGTRVRVTTADELAEIYDVRAELEAYAGSIGLASLGQRLADLRACVAEMIGFAAEADVIGFGEANARFHRLIVEASGNGTLLEVWTRLDVRSRTTINMIRSSGDLDATARSHEPIIEAIAAGSSAALKRELRQHIRKFRPQPVPANATAATGEQSHPDNAG